MSTPRSQALARINGSITADGTGVVYYDDSTQLHYLAPIEDLQELQDLMDDPDESVSSDAYSHWCAGTSHPEYDQA
jgi:hypothetical protein